MQHSISSINAITPDQLLPYVAAVSGLHSSKVGNSILHHAGAHGVLVAYSRQSGQDVAAIDADVAKVLEMPEISHLAVLSDVRPTLAPQNARVQNDCYWFMPLPPAAPQGKLRNMLKRAARDVKISSGGPETWTGAHAALVDDFCKRRSATLDEGSVYIFSKLTDYLANAPESVLFSATVNNGGLAGFAIGDYTALSTAFYMFAFRNDDAPPGTADLLLNAICQEGEKRGHTRLNLGLGIDAGIEFFKKKWGAKPELAYVETAWEVERPRKGWFSRLFGASK